jgi:hypothetical protein
MVSFPLKLQRMQHRKISATKEKLVLKTSEFSLSLFFSVALPIQKKARMVKLKIMPTT